MSTSEATWPIQRIRDLVTTKFDKRACLFQIKIACAIRQRQNDVVGIAATGSGKTLSFWIPLLMALEDKEDKCMIVVTPLNLLGQQNVDLLSKAGIGAIAVDGSNATNETFMDIAAVKHRVIVMNPEILMQEGGHCEKLWKMPTFTSRLLYIVFDEGHCIQEWNAFREQYKYVGMLRHLIPNTVPFYVASATLPASLLVDVTELLQLRKDRTEHIIRSNDRPDIALGVQMMQHAAHTFKDLDFLIPDNFQEGDVPPPKFLVFCNSVKETEAACKYLRRRLPHHLRQEKIKYFHASMSPFFRVDEYERFKSGDRYGLCVTDAFGMGLDLSGIQLIIQWKVPTSMNTLWQRFGRAARGPGEFAFAILIAEKQYFDVEIKKREEAKEKRRAREKRRKEAKASGPKKNSPQKRRAHAGPSDHPSAAGPAALPSSRDNAMPARSDCSSEGTDDAVEGASAIAVGIQSDPALEARESEARAVADEERRSIYNEREEGRVGGAIARRKDRQPPQAAILDLINADVRDIGCRRRPVTLVYSNDKRDSPTGCLRCAPTTSIVCCDLCHPIAFEGLAVSGARPTRGLRKSTIKRYDLGQQERDLRNALLKWSDDETESIYGPTVLNIYAGSLFLPLDMLDRIVDCAHAGKLSSREDFKREIVSAKDWAERYMDKVLEIIRGIYPQPADPEPIPPPAPQAGDLADNAPQPEATRRKKARTYVCSRCGQPGHNSAYYLYSLAVLV
ncbi:P-loop containing nucleoside triphosphate hydrolase protein [Rhodofomes roseus]|uniref:DNA 3'-5' helicase n=1 Tax=Rhodofomes roseus TaxID=34475 RepID=A0ABQ8KLR4_9APHY|nr:P-loop containing nucleoside triphosphate hydrolase protein [Rhodofomes roseus]KAH9839264.1 P-loop containing nucleoside triphosphate hydrolase protein [Rhodofomes roseus]